MPAKKSEFRRPLIILGLILVLPGLISGLLALGWNHYREQIISTATSEGLAQADAILVFGAAIADRGQPGTILKSRIEHALALYHQGCADNFILTGGVGWGPPAESVVMKRVLSDNGVKEWQMHFETTSHTTKEQVEFAITTTRQQGWQKLIAVSDPWHLYRIVRYFDKSGLEVIPSPARGIEFSSDETREYIQAEMLKLLAWLLFGL